MNFQWPDLYFGPINLWTAPWLGRTYEEFHRYAAQTAYVGKSNPAAQVEQINKLTKNR